MMQLVIKIHRITNVQVLINVKKVVTGCEKLDTGCEKIFTGCEKLDAGIEKLDAGLQKFMSIRKNLCRYEKIYVDTK